MSTPVNTSAFPLAGSPSIPNRVATKNDNNPTWLDTEMTGLSPEDNRIIRVAVMVTDSEPNILVESPALITHQSDELLGGMGAWNKGTHDCSGLIDKAKVLTTTEAEAEAELLAPLRKWMPKNKSLMYDSSICQDRRLMARYMFRLEEYFHYRNLDISTPKEPCKRWQPAIMEDFMKHQQHTVFASIIELIEKLRYYHEHFIRDAPQAPDTEALTSSVVP